MTTKKKDRNDPPPPETAAAFFDQAVHDIDTAAYLRAGGRHAWACYVAAQAAEKAAKGLRLLGGTALDQIKVHDMASLLDAAIALAYPSGLAGSDVSTDLATSHQQLSGLDQNTRYPTLVRSGPAFHHYGQEESAKALGAAKTLIAFCHDTAPRLAKAWRV